MTVEHIEDGIYSASGRVLGRLIIVESDGRNDARKGWFVLARNYLKGLNSG